MRKQALCVDLDGTLITTDTLWESVVLFAKQKPWLLPSLVLWLFRGRAHLKHEIASRVSLNSQLLPYRQGLLEYLHVERNKGRFIVLVTGADRNVAEPISRHLALFSEVIASDGSKSITGKAKQQMLVERFGDKGFDYVADGWADISVWESASRAIVVGSNGRLMARLRRLGVSFECMPHGANLLRASVRSLRMHQWAKNALVFLPVIAGHKILDLGVVKLALAAFGIFCLCASGSYILNDLLDIETDRRHPEKRNRPFAAGQLSIGWGLLMSAVLLTVSFLWAWIALSWHFVACLGAYFLATTAYSFWLKKLPIVDVLILSCLYTLRVVAGGTATAIRVSAWLLALAVFLFWSLAFLKRYVEVSLPQAPDSGTGLTGRGYRETDKAMLPNMGLTSGYLSVLVLALYINSEAVALLYRHPGYLWLVCPLLLYWVSRIWLLAHRGEVSGDPVLFALRDPPSYVVGVLIALIAILAL